jgi:hypothetical protein
MIFLCYNFFLSYVLLSSFLLICFFLSSDILFVIVTVLDLILEYVFLSCILQWTFCGPAKFFVGW